MITKIATHDEHNKQPITRDAQLPEQLYGVVQKSGHPRNSMGVRFFGPPCISKMTYKSISQSINQSINQSIY